LHAAILLKAARTMSEAQTLKARVLDEIRGTSWDVPEIARQFGCGERMVFYHFRQGLSSRLVNGKRVTTPAEAEEYLRNRLSGQLTH
jgi:hypothetical protein